MYTNEAYQIAEIVKITMNADLINMAQLGNEVNHYHWHIIPRYKNDFNWGRPPWPNSPVELKEFEFNKIKNALSHALIIS
jgi:diadenosine tetraphosphate (Ap4A) HIT family hydrolase